MIKPKRCLLNAAGHKQPPPSSKSGNLQPTGMSSSQVNPSVSMPSEAVPAPPLLSVLQQSTAASTAPMPLMSQLLAKLPHNSQTLTSGHPLAHAFSQYMTAPPGFQIPRDQPILTGTLPSSSSQSGNLQPTGMSSSQVNPSVSMPSEAVPAPPLLSVLQQSTAASTAPMPLMSQLLAKLPHNSQTLTSGHPLAHAFSQYMTAPPGFQIPRDQPILTGTLPSSSSQSGNLQPTGMSSSQVNPSVSMPSEAVPAPPLLSVLQQSTAASTAPMPLMSQLPAKLPHNSQTLTSGHPLAHAFSQYMTAPPGFQIPQDQPILTGTLPSSSSQSGNLQPTGMSSSQVNPSVSMPSEAVPAPPLLPVLQQSTAASTAPMPPLEPTRRQIQPDYMQALIREVSYQKSEAAKWQEQAKLKVRQLSKLETSIETGSIPVNYAKNLYLQLKRRRLTPLTSESMSMPMSPPRSVNLTHSTTSSVKTIQSSATPSSSSQSGNLQPTGMSSSQVNPSVSMPSEAVPAPPLLPVLQQSTAASTAPMPLMSQLPAKLPHNSQTLTSGHPLAHAFSQYMTAPPGFQIPRDQPILTGTLPSSSSQSGNLQPTGMSSSQVNPSVSMPSEAVPAPPLLSVLQQSTAASTAPMPLMSQLPAKLPHNSQTLTSGHPLAHAFSQYMTAPPGFQIPRDQPILTGTLPSSSSQSGNLQPTGMSSSQVNPSVSMPSEAVPAPPLLPVLQQSTAASTAPTPPSANPKKLKRVFPRSNSNLSIGVEHGLLEVYHGKHALSRHDAETLAARWNTCAENVWIFVKKLIRYKKNSTVYTKFCMHCEAVVPDMAGHVMSESHLQVIEQKFMII